MRTVDAQSAERIGIGRALLRTIIKFLPWEISHLSNNFPLPMRYDPEPGMRLGFLVVPVLVAFYLLVMLFNPKRRSVDDFAAGTVVLRD